MMLLSSCQQLVRSQTQARMTGAAIGPALQSDHAKWYIQIVPISTLRFMLSSVS